MFLHQQGVSVWFLNKTVTCVTVACPVSKDSGRRAFFFAQAFQ